MGSLGWPELLVVGLVVLVLFGAKKLPEIGRSFGKGLREFKNSVSGLGEESAPAAIGDGRKFCVQCGKPLGSDARFCAQCGAKVGEPAGAAKS